MDKNQWVDFLDQWSQTVLASGLSRAFPEEVTSSGWLGYPGASAEEIRKAEGRLGTKLPPSYRAFLEVSNGWRMVRPTLTRFWSTSEIEWLRIRRPELISAWKMGEAMFGGDEPVSDEEYFVYGEQQDSAWLRSEYLQRALEVSDLDPEMDAIYLLNPQVVNEAGEWEAWYFSSSLPGAVRYRSFQEMMQAEYRGCLEDLEHEKEFSVEYLSHVRERLQTHKVQEINVDLEALVEALGGAIEKQRRDADKTSARPNRLPSYHQATMEALQEVTDKVRDLQDRTLNDQQLVLKLGELAENCERKSEGEIKSFMENLDMWQVLRAGLDFKLRGERAGLESQFLGGGMPAGYMTAAMIIREHLRPRTRG